jgi:O-Antigen ligase
MTVLFHPLVNKTQRIKQRLIATDIRSLFFYVYLLSPFLIFNNFPNKTRVLRILVFVFILGFVFSVSEIRNHVVQNFKSLTKLVKFILIFVVTMAVFSALRSVETSKIVLFGISPEYNGGLLWASYLLLGLLFKDIARSLLLSRTTIYIFLAMIASSLVFDKFYITHGYRVGGLLLQATSMAAYASIGAVLALNRLSNYKKLGLRYWPEMLLFILSLVTIVLTQSRVGYIELVIVLSLWSLKYVRKSPRIVIALLMVIIALPIMTNVNQSFFARFRSESIERGWTYRIDLYKISAQDLLKHNVIVGNGPGTLPPAINNLNVVPDEIALTLNMGIVFGSTHDMFLDMSYYFGIISSLGIILISLLAFSKRVFMDNESYVLLLIFIILIMNALFNTQSIELTSLYFIVLFALLPTSLSVKRLNETII